MISSSVGMTVWVRGMALFASLISTFNRMSLLDCFGVIITGYTHTGDTRLLYPLNYQPRVSPIRFQLGSYTEQYSPVGLCNQSYCGINMQIDLHPFIFPILRNRSAYSFNRLLVIVSSLWTVFTTLTRPRSSVVWKPIKGSVFFCPFIT